MIQSADGSCGCGAHRTQISWNDRMRRAAGEAYAECRYQRPEAAMARLDEVLAGLSPDCDTPLSRTLRNWNARGRPLTELDRLTRALCDDIAFGRLSAVS